MAALCKITWVLYFSFCGNSCTSGMKRNPIILQVVESSVHVQVVEGSVHVHQLISLVSEICGHSEHVQGY